MTESEADKACSVCPWPSFPGHSAGLKGARVERPGQGQDSAPLHCQGQLHSGDVAQNRSARGHSMNCRASEKTSGGQKGLGAMRRLPSASAAIYSMYTTQGCKIT